MSDRKAYEAGLRKIGWRRNESEDVAGYEAYTYKNGHIKVYISDNDIRIGLSFKWSQSLNSDAKHLLILRSKANENDNGRFALQG
jgi:hypothetical protein